MYEWIMTEAVQVRATSPDGEHAIIETEDRTRAVAVVYHGHTDIMFFNELPYRVGEAAAECLATWIHTAAVEFGTEEMLLRENEWDEDNLGALLFESL